MYITKIKKHYIQAAKFKPTDRVEYKYEVGYKFVSKMTNIFKKFKLDWEELKRGSQSAIYILSGQYKDMLAFAKGDGEGFDKQEFDREVFPEGKFIDSDDDIGYEDEDDDD